MAYGIIYKLTNKISGKIYVGKTIHRLSERFSGHKCANSVVGQAIRKYGVENFSVEVIEECDSLESLNEREKFWIRELNCKSPNGYNLTDGGDGLVGCTQETREKISRAKTGKKLSKEACANIAAALAKRYADPAAHERLSIAQRKRYAERPPTDETRAKTFGIAGDARKISRHVEKTLG